MSAHNRTCYVEVVHFLTHLFSLQVTNEDFSNILVAAGFTGRQALSLIELYDENKKVIAEIFQKTDDLSYFYDLHWRFETKVP